MNTFLQDRTLLLVDDRPENILVLEALLEHSGAVLHKAFSGNEALKFLYCAQPKPDCVLMDVQMPLMSGYETAALLKKVAATAAIPVVFVTATEAAGTGVEPEFAHVLTAPVFLHKPLTTDNLFATLRKVLQQEA